MENSSSFLKWIGGILAAVIAGLVLWYFTDRNKHSDTIINNPKGTNIIVPNNPEAQKPELLLGIDINPQSADIGFGQQTTIQISVYDRNDQNKAIGNAKVSI